MAKAKVAILSSLSRAQRHLPRYRLLDAIILLLPVVAIPGALWWRWRQRDGGNVLPTSTTMKDEKVTVGRHQLVSEHYSVKYISVPSGREDVLRFAAIADLTDESISIQEWLTMVSTNSLKGMRAASDLSAIIAASQYTSLLFETPGTSWLASSTTPFEFALVDAPALRVFAEGSTDRYAFAEHFNAASKQEERNSVCSFSNLGGDASLVSPLPPSDGNDASYSHLAIFLRNAPRSQVAEFWELAAATYLRVLKEKEPMEKSWFSTNGMGVAWLHLRIDDRPKYYSYAPFKR
jgi:hypothetical protein